MALNASRTTCWSGKATGISVVSPGISIVLCLMLMSGGLARLSSRRGAVGSVSWVGVLCLGARLLRPAGVTPGHYVMVGVGVWHFACVVVVWVYGISHV